VIVVVDRSVSFTLMFAEVIVPDEALYFSFGQAEESVVTT
jgi:hypothetical protein